MTRPRLQFRLSTLLWLTLAVSCWFGGMRFERWRAKLAEKEEPRPIMVTGGGSDVLGNGYTITHWSDGRSTIERSDGSRSQWPDTNQ
jgi:hypothetical protein